MQKRKLGKSGLEVSALGLGFMFLEITLLQRFVLGAPVFLLDVAVGQRRSQSTRHAVELAPLGDGRQRERLGDGVHDGAEHDRRHRGFVGCDGARAILHRADQRVLPKNRDQLVDSVADDLDERGDLVDRLELALGAQGDAAAVALDCTARGQRYGALDRLRAIRRELGVPVFADIDPKTHNIDLDQLEAMEDEADIEAARRALKDSRRIPYEEVRRKAGLA